MSPPDVTRRTRRAQVPPVPQWHAEHFPRDAARRNRRVGGHLLVDVEEVRGADLDGLTSLALADRLRVADKVTRKPIAGSHLRTVAAINPVNRCPVTIVPTEEVERFETEFVTLFAIARQQGRHHMAVKKELEAASVKPAFDPEKVGATFYQRTAVNRKFRMVLDSMSSS
ncbi:hypothetical protein ACVWZM_004107 [Bradyrhizobium sp. USDA 4501]